MLEIDPNDISIKELHQYLLSSIGPRPIALASTIDVNGINNVSPFSFFNVFSANPPILIFSPARRVRNNTTKDTLENVKKIKEAIYNPDQGLYARVRDLEQWQQSVSKFITFT